MSPSWFIIGALILLAIALLEFKDFKHRILLFTIIGLFLFLIVSMGYVYFSSDTEFNFSSFEGLVDSGKVYVSWLDGFFGNIGSVTSYAIKQTWGFKNSTAAG